MATIRFEAGMIGARLRADAVGGPKAVKLALFSGAQRGRSWIVGKTPVDRGILRNAWKVVKLSDGVELVNDQPYAGIMERGARPFKMSPAGIEALAGWVKRKILSGGIGPGWAAKRAQTENRNANRAMGKGQYGPKRNTNFRSLQMTQESALDKEAKSIAFAIAKKWERVGKQGTRFIWKQLPVIANLMDEEIKRFLVKFFDRSI